MYRPAPNFARTAGFALPLALMLAACDRLPASPSSTSPPDSQSGTIQLAGSVTDAAWRPLAGARVEVVEGPQAGLSTTTDANGDYFLRGSFDDATRFRATKDGHAPSTFSLPPACDPCNPHWWIHFALEALAPKPNLAGDYSLTVVANSTCAALPDAVRSRTYEATVTLQAGPDFAPNSQFEVSVSTPPFLEQHRSFQLGVAGDYVGGFAGDLHGFPGLAERITPTSYFAIGGSIEGSADSSGTVVTASLSGVIDYCEVSSEMGQTFNCDTGPVVAHKKCESTHQLILRRR